MSTDALPCKLHNGKEERKKKQRFERAREEDKNKHSKSGGGATRAGSCVWGLLEKKPKKFLVMLHADARQASGRGLPRENGRLNT